VAGRFVEGMTWLEAERALRELPTALLPIGARCKEHGPHLPLNNDWRLAEYLARRVAERCAVLVLPTLDCAYYPAFTTYPGSVSLRESTFRDVVVDIAESWARHGVRRLAVLNTGVSTRRPLEAAREQLAERGVELCCAHRDEFARPVRARVETQEAGSHADEIETSIMLHIAPETVQLERAVRDIHPQRGPGGLSRDPDAPHGTYSPSGSYGDPTLATRAKGETLVEGLVDALVSWLQPLTARPAS